MTDSEKYTIRVKELEHTYATMKLLRNETLRFDYPCETRDIRIDTIDDVSKVIAKLIPIEYIEGQHTKRQGAEKDCLELSDAERYFIRANTLAEIYQTVRSGKMFWIYFSIGGEEKCKAKIEAHDEVLNEIEKLLYCED